MITLTTQDGLSGELIFYQQAPSITLAGVAVVGTDNGYVVCDLYESVHGLPTSGDVVTSDSYEDAMAEAMERI